MKKKPHETDPYGSLAMIYTSGNLEIPNDLKRHFLHHYSNQNPAQTSFWLAAAAARLQLFRCYAMLQRCFAAKLQKCFVEKVETENDVSIDVGPNR